MRGNSKMIKAKAFLEGESIKFVDYVATPMETRFGETTLIEFAGADGEIFRSLFDTKKALLSQLRERPEATTVTLKKYITSGEYKRPIWIVE